MGRPRVEATRVSRSPRRLRMPALGAPGDVVALSPADLHHLRTVLRLPAGVTFVGFAEGHEAEFVLDPEGRAIVQSEPREIEAPPPLHLVFALPKGSPLDTLLRMAVEIGATHLHPALTDRTLPKGDHPERWSRILTSAAQQCGRADVPTLSPLRPLREAAPAVGEVPRWVGVPGGAPAPTSVAQAALAVGPEGGFTPSELEYLVGTGWRAASFSPFVLRVDTAAAIGLALLRGPAPGHNPAPDK